MKSMINAEEWKRSLNNFFSNYQSPQESNAERRENVRVQRVILYAVCTFEIHIFVFFFSPLSFLYIYIYWDVLSIYFSFLLFRRIRLPRIWNNVQNRKESEMTGAHSMNIIIHNLYKITNLLAFVKSIRVRYITRKDNKRIIYLIKFESLRIDSVHHYHISWFLCHVQ